MTAAPEALPIQTPALRPDFDEEESSMPSSPFVGEWRIDDWSHNTVEVPHGIPTGAFLLNGVLTITQPNVNSFSLQWPDQSGHIVTMSGLQSNEAQTELRGQNLLVDFGSPQGEVSCDITVSLTDLPEGKQLNGRISLPPLFVGREQLIEFSGPEIGNGTFTATANGGPGPVDTGD